MIRSIIFIILFSIATHVSAETILIPKHMVINQPTLYSGVTLNLHQGSFEITNNATLTIKDCQIEGTVGPNNPVLFNVTQGKLVLQDNQIVISAPDIAPTPTNPTLYAVIRTIEGKVKISHNSARIKNPYRVSWLVTSNTETSDFDIRYNRFSNFHGGLFLKNSHRALVTDNTFINVSISNIFTEKSHHSWFKHNTLLFAGNNNVGDGVDIIDSDHITLSNNYILGGSCYSIMLLRDNNITLKYNHVIGGITYAISIRSHIGSLNPELKYLKPFISESPASSQPNNQIIIKNNYISQNRYGISAEDVNQLTVSNNIFIQHFTNNIARKFWTNNRVLLKNINYLKWHSNWYKEAFTQEPKGFNGKSMRLIPFPSHDGVEI